MRLTCPNCGAQYEVDAAVIPEEGRDVQCSNCGHTWFQLSEGAQMAPAEEAPEPAPEPAPATAPAPAAAEATRRSLDPDLASILKEEAEREQRARREEAAEAFQEQPELGLDAPAGQRAALKERVARLRGVEHGEPEQPEAAAAVSAVVPQRDLLPDIEQINATLSASSDRGADSIVTAEEEQAVHRSGFRRGFAAVILVAAAALSLYLAAPTIGGLHPALEAPMAAYAALIDGWRAWLNTAIAAAMDGVTGATNGNGG